VGTGNISHLRMENDFGLLKSRIWFVTPKNSHSISGDIRSAEPRIRDSAVNVLLARHTVCKGFLLSAVHRYTIEADIWIH